MRQRSSLQPGRAGRRSPGSIICWLVFHSITKLFPLSRATGIYHPLIQFGFGIEFDQPATVAEGLAQASIHGQTMHKYLFACEKAASQAEKVPDVSIVNLVHEIRDTSGNSKQDIVNIASKVAVDVANLDRKTAEMVNACGLSNYQSTS
jgi:hypothetical protein